jgi:glutamyl/glutaminyl-tRNA synthetase
VEKFGVDRINKSPAVFDVVKLNWMNGQHIRLMPAEEQVAMVGAVLVADGLAESVDSPFTEKAVTLCANGIELVQDAAKEVGLDIFPLTLFCKSKRIRLTSCTNASGRPADRVGTFHNVIILQSKH